MKIKKGKAIGAPSKKDFIIACEVLKRMITKMEKDNK